MIEYITGGNICYDSPANTIGLVIILTGIILVSFILSRAYQMRIK